MPHPLVTRVGLSLAGTLQSVSPDDDVTHAANDLDAEATAATDAATLSARKAAATANWAAAVMAEQAAKERCEHADAALERAEGYGQEGARKQDSAENLDELKAKAEEARAELEAKKRDAAAARTAASTVAGPTASAPAGGFDPIDIDGLHAEQKERLAAALADSAELPDLTLFAGFLGGRVDRGDKNPWRLVYLDSRLYSWLLVQETDILVHQRLPDDHAPSGLRDVLWVRGNANVIQGSGPQSTAGRFLVGEFTRAGDFAASTSGGTFSAATGLLCEATTPGCCIKPRTR